MLRLTGTSAPRMIRFTPGARAAAEFVDHADAGMGMGAAQDFQMEEVGKPVIVIIRRGAGDMAQHVLPLRRLTDFLEVVVALVGENVFAEFQHGLTLPVVL